MPFNVKSLSLLLVSTSLMGCMGEAQPITSTPTETASPTIGTSIADNVIRPEVVKQVREDKDIIEGRKSLRDLDNRLKPYETLLASSTNQQEKDFIELYMKSLKFKHTVDNAQSEEERSKARAIALDQIRPLRQQFIQSYLQSPELRSLLIKLHELQTNELKQAEPDDELRRKQEAATKEFVAFFENPDLDAQTKAEIEALDRLGVVTQKDVQSLKEALRYIAAQPSSSPEVPHASPEVSLRQARLGDSKDGGTINTSHLSVNHISGSQARLSVPLHIHLKGTIEGSKQTEDVTGATVYKVNDTLLGLIYGYANTSRARGMPLKHHETSAVIAHSFGRTYVEAQAGFVTTTFGQGEIGGERYQMSVGHDFERVTPFIQATVRRFNPVKELAVYAGCEVDIMHLAMGQDSVSSNLTVKGGYHAFKGLVASIEGSLELKLSQGVTMQTALNLSPWEASTLKIGVAFTQ